MVLSLESNLRTFDFMPEFILFDALCESNMDFDMALPLLYDIPRFVMFSKVSVHTFFPSSFDCYLLIIVILL